MKRCQGLDFANVLGELRKEQVPICLQYIHSGFFIYEFLLPSTKMKAEVLVCTNHTDFENN